MQALAELWQEQGFAQTFGLVHYEGNLLYVVGANAARTTFFSSYLLSAAINSGQLPGKECVPSDGELRQNGWGGARWLWSADGMSRSPPRLALHHLRPPPSSIPAPCRFHTTFLPCRRPHERKKTKRTSGPSRSVKDAFNCIFM